MSRLGFLNARTAVFWVHCQSTPGLSAPNSAGCHPLFLIRKMFSDGGRSWMVPTL